MRPTLISALALLALAAAPGRLVAQAAAFKPIAASEQILIAAAELRMPASPTLGLEPSVGDLMTRRARGNQRQGEILMIVGVAGIVTGLVAHEDLITIAGAGVGGFGLYRYLQATL
jgi:hypothetical protein